MLGEQIAEARGKITGQRVLDVEGPKIEYSFAASGTMKGIQIAHIATFYTIPKGNILYGQGQGVITTRDGSGDMATEIGHGIGEFIDNGKKVKFRGSFFYKASSSGTFTKTTTTIRRKRTGDEIALPWSKYSELSEVDQGECLNVRAANSKGEPFAAESLFMALILQQQEIIKQLIATLSKPK